VRGARAAGALTLVFALLLGAAATSVSAASTLAFSTTTLASGLVGTAYQATLSASGGVPPYQWSVGSGPLPGGMILSSTGLLSGLPASAGSSSISFRVTDASGAVANKTLVLVVNRPPPPPEVLVAVGANGLAEALGNVASLAPLLAAASPFALGGAPAVAIATPPTGGGYWVTSASGVVTAVGLANHGSIGARVLRGRIVAMASTTSGRGYWLLSSNGRVYGFGDARRGGSLAPNGRRDRLVGIAADREAGGYLVASADGHVGAFGGAINYGGVAPGHLRGRIVGIAALAGGGYVLVSSRGHCYLFGPATQVALPNPRPNAAVAVAAAPSGAGFFVVDTSGRVYPAGSARALGTLSALAPVAALAATS
jgi:hypothetical protein